MSTSNLLKILSKAKKILIICNKVQNKTNNKVTMNQNPWVSFFLFRPTALHDHAASRLVKLATSETVFTPLSSWRQIIQNKLLQKLGYEIMGSKFFYVCVCDHPSLFWANFSFPSHRSALKCCETPKIRKCL